MDISSQDKVKRSKPRKGIKSLKGNQLGSFEPLGRRRGSKARARGRGVIYIGRIPHGFYEDQMMGYFSQFGKVVSAVVSRSKKTGRSKGYGFVEFDDEEVAKIAAETMNNYLMYNKVIKCRFIPEEERGNYRISANTFKLTHPRVLNRIADARRKRESYLKLDKTEHQRKTDKKIKEFQKFFEERGINFNLKIHTDSAKNSDKTKSAKEGTEHLSNSNHEIDDQFGVLEIDQSDGDIEFKIPPEVKKVIKKNYNSSVISESSCWETVKETKEKKEQTSKQMSKKIKTIKRISKILTESNDAKGKTKNLSKKEKGKTSTRKNQVLLKQKKGKRKEAIENVKKSSKDKSKMKQNCQKAQSRKLTLRTPAGEKKK